MAGSSIENPQPLRIALDARLVSGRSGGVEQAIISLAHGLSQLDGPERYYFLTYPNHQAWIRPYIGGPCRLLLDSELYLPPSPSLWKRKLLRWFPQLVQLRNKQKKADREITLPRSNGIIEKAGIDIMHFSKQSAFLTGVPSLYQPWDLLHLHYPEAFDAQAVAYRDASYRAYCQQAAYVTVASAWVKADVQKYFQIEDEKIRVIPFAPPLEAYPDISDQEIQAVKEKYALPESFILYPAQPYPHKNHNTLLQAVAHLREGHGIDVPLVCTGRLNDYYAARIHPLVKHLGLTSQVSFTGFVHPVELKSMYAQAKMLVFPSKFEGWGLPILEAFQAGLPVAASNVTSLPEVVGDAGLLFDPDNHVEMAGVIKELWTNDILTRELAERGQQRLKNFSTKKTALAFRSLYRQLAGRLDIA